MRIMRLQDLKSEEFQAVLAVMESVRNAHQQPTASALLFFRPKRQLGNQDVDSLWSRQIQRRL